MSILRGFGRAKTPVGYGMSRQVPSTLFTTVTLCRTVRIALADTTQQAATTMGDVGTQSKGLAAESQAAPAGNGSRQGTHRVRSDCI